MYSHEKEEGEKGLCLIHMQVSKMSALYTIISSASHDPDCFVYFESQSIRKLIYSFNLTIESKLLFVNIQLLVVYILLIPDTRKRKQQQNECTLEYFYAALT